MALNFQQRGAERDQLAVDTLTEWGVMDTEQIQLLLFPSHRVAQRRLSKMLALGRINRCEQTAPYSYYVNPQKDIITRLNENWVRLWITKNLKQWEYISRYDYKTYTVTNRKTGAIEEFNLIGVKFPSVAEIREQLKGGTENV